MMICREIDMSNFTFTLAFCVSVILEDLFALYDLYMFLWFPSPSDIVILNARVFVVQV